MFHIWIYCDICSARLKSGIVDIFTKASECEVVMHRVLYILFHQRAAEFFFSFLDCANCVSLCLVLEERTKNPGRVMQ